MIADIVDLADGDKFHFTQTLPHLKVQTYIKGTHPRWGKAVYTSLKTGEQFRCSNQTREVKLVLNCISCGVEYEDDGFVHCDYCHDQETNRIEEKNNDT